MSDRRLEPGESLRVRVARMLSLAIISGELAPGTLLTVPRVAERFAVSATPVREAMLDLEKRGFVETVRNKGFRVTAVSDELLQDIVEIRLLLEPPAMARVAGAFPAGRLADFRAQADAIVAGARSGDLPAYLLADQAFHLELTALLGNDVLVETIADLRERTRLVGLVSMVESSRLHVSADEHHRLLDHLAAGDADAAEALMRQHIRHAIGWWAGRAEDPRPRG
ncbi:MULTISPECIES: GntR family transcriptional regulator [Glycomyces]|jgi:DNA-binding GntR family transcriptional regulator|uniref:GntR family transcriptional regulator n=2 Tax=Glycomyces TaxID=58113 RepID=A0A9X3PGC9_9ACTN|nr:GntR family transcriptional regulator [Glycomyces lechevalierae]MDA1383450.1 GntR family transcriptional regulator [Glycomyces lechevalierae]MDR7336456.1 DNA-binding GntR family transcriptional regulator [Glycomyces lechevalierae]